MKRTLLAGLILGAASLIVSCRTPITLPPPVPPSVDTTATPTWSSTATGALSTATSTSTPTPTSTSGTGTCFMLDDNNDGDLVNATNGIWNTYRWTTIPNNTPVTPWQAEVIPGTIACGVSVCPNPDLSDGSVYQSANYSVRITGFNEVNSGSTPVTYSGFGLVTSLSAGYQDLSWMQSFDFWVRADQPCIIRLDFVCADVTACNNNQYGYSVTILTSNTWQNVDHPIVYIACQDWGQATCPPCGVDRNTALSHVETIRWRAEGPPHTQASGGLTFWVDDICLRGASIPPTATPVP